MTRVSELNGALLDYWVAKADGADAEIRNYTMNYGKGPEVIHYCNIKKGNRPFSPSDDWLQGGPIIERERININERDGDCWGAFYSGNWTKFGPTPLIAAMRAYVASKFGDEVPEQAA